MRTESADPHVVRDRAVAPADPELALAAADAHREADSLLISRETRKPGTAPQNAARHHERAITARRHAHEKMPAFVGEGTRPGNRHASDIRPARRRRMQRAAVAQNRAVRGRIRSRPTPCGMHRAIAADSHRAIGELDRPHHRIVRCIAAVSVRNSPRVSDKQTTCPGPEIAVGLAETARPLA